ATSSEDFSIFKTIADSCERGKLDFLFVGDSLAFVPDQHPGQMLRFEPLTLHAALATQTSRVGLVATASTTYSAPFNIARIFASLDPANVSGSANQLSDAQAAAGVLGLKLQVLHASSKDDFETALIDAIQQRASGLVIAPDPLFANRSESLASLALRQK